MFSYAAGNLSDAKIGLSWSEGEDRERADRFCADGNKTGKLLGGRSCGRKARNFCYWAPEDRRQVQFLHNIAEYGFGKREKKTRVPHAAHPPSSHF